MQEMSRNTTVACVAWITHLLQQNQTLLHINSHLTQSTPQPYYYTNKLLEWCKQLCGKVVTWMIALEYY